jgi:TRAP-type mannitol/chloroaromatic compound transport system permease large subunit
MLLFTMKSVAPKEIRMNQIFRAVTPYVIMGILMLVLVVAFPPLATWLPKLLIGR